MAADNFSEKTILKFVLVVKATLPHMIALSATLNKALLHPHIIRSEKHEPPPNKGHEVGI